MSKQKIKKITVYIPYRNGRPHGILSRFTVYTSREEVPAGFGDVREAVLAVPESEG